MTVRSSFDEGRSWSQGKIVHAGPSTYSDMVKLSDVTAGFLYEAGVQNPYGTITFARLDVHALDS